MKYEKFLFTRTKTADYRWLIVPSNVSNLELSKFKGIFMNLVENFHQSFGNPDLRPIYFFDLPGRTVLMRARESEFTDAYSRRIFLLEGISVHKIHRRHLWFASPWLLSTHDNYLNIQNNLPFEEADKISNQTSDTFTLDMNSFDRIDELSFEDHIQQIYDGKTVEFPYTPDGYNDFIKILGSPKVPLINIAFGCTKSISSMIPNLRIVSWLSKAMSSNRDEDILKNISIPASTKTQRLSDPTERFKRHYDDEKSS